MSNMIHQRVGDDSRSSSSSSDDDDDDDNREDNTMIARMLKDTDVYNEEEQRSNTNNNKFLRMDGIDGSTVKCSNDNSSKLSHTVVVSRPLSSSSSLVERTWIKAIMIFGLLLLFEIYTNIRSISLNYLTSSTTTTATKNNGTTMNKEKSIVAPLEQPMTRSDSDVSSVAAASWDNNNTNNNNHHHVILVTGAAGHLGSIISKRLLLENNKVIGLDHLLNINDDAKNERIQELSNQYDKFIFIKGDVCDQTLVNDLIKYNHIDTVLHLASNNFKRTDGYIRHPFHYPLNNIDCFVNILEILRENNDNTTTTTTTSTTSATSQHQIPRLFYVPSIVDIQNTSINSNSTQMIMSVTASSSRTMQQILRPNNNEELIAKAYMSLYNISSTSLRLPSSLYDVTLPDAWQEYDDNTVVIQRTVDHVKKQLSSEEGKAKGANIVQLYDDDSNYSKDSSSHISSSLSLSSSPQELCFVTSMFSSSTKKTDKIRNITSYNHTFPFRYMVFTNLHNLTADGWEKVYMDDLPYKRMITQSRWPKFMGWQHPIIQNNCKVVIYSDANLSPKNLPQTTWENITQEALITNSSGIYQRPNTRVNERKHLTIIEELQACVHDHKDLKENVDASIQWFLQQSDFNNDAYGYWNMIFIYDPHNPLLQELMTTFWTHYSLETQSWRDQPLWRYIVDKLNIKPKIKRSFGQYFHSKSGKNKRPHKYTTKDNDNGNIIKL